MNDNEEDQPAEHDLGSLFELQWYNRIPSRLQRETTEMVNRYPTLTLEEMRDDRFCWTGDIIIQNNQLSSVFIYPYLFPLEPPTLYIDLDSRFSKILTEDSSIALFNISTFSWNPQMTLADVLDHVLQYLEIHFSMIDSKQYETRNERIRKQIIVLGSLKKK
jgi:ubiquitin-protein ligase